MASQTFATIANGDYQIVNASNTSWALDVSGASKANGANVMLWEKNFSEAQVFRIQGNSDGSYRIKLRWSGKSVDVANGTIANDTNIQQYENNDSRAQKWKFEKVSAQSYMGKTYDTYKICLAANTKYVVDPQGYRATFQGANVSLWQWDEGRDQTWLLVPVPLYREGGLYEIRSLTSPKVCLDVAGNGTANGTNVQIYAANGTNAQKFAIERNGSAWWVRHVGSGKYLDVWGDNALKSGANVHIWKKESSRDQTWTIAEDGTTSFNGKAVQVVRFGAYGGAKFSLDLAECNTSNSANVQIYETHQGSNQRWLLVPTSAVDPTLPVPTNLGWASAVKATPYANMTSQANVLYMSWESSDAWYDGSSHFQTRYRKCYLKSSNNSWTSWSAWTQWDEANYAHRGKRFWDADGIDVGYPIEDYKNMQVEFSVRCVGDDGLALLVGNKATKTVNAIWKPTESIGAAGWTPEGLRLSYATDYAKGRCKIFVNSIKRGGVELLDGVQEFANLDEGGDFIIPQGSLRAVPDDGDMLKISTSVGNDQYARFGGSRSHSVTVAYDSNHGLDVQPTFEDEGYCLVATVKNAGTTSMWLGVGGKFHELDMLSKAADGTTRFVVPIPFGRPFDVYTDGVDGDSWGTDVTRMPAYDDRACHAWTWKGGRCAISVKEGGGMATRYRLAPTYEANSLDNRERQSVLFARTFKGSFTADGSIDMDELGTSTTADFVDLQNAGHARYQAPNGEIAEVAVTGVDFKSYSGYTDVSVSMVEEAR